AKMKGLTTVLHNQPLGIGTAVLVHFAAANYNSLGHATEVFGDVMMEDNLIEKRIPRVKGMIKVPKGPGWGVELDEKALEKYMTGPTVVIK
ncbi:MAG: mandelate racemase/muconate lactonizing enzyme family protein, partial [archaeon]|nr:mandelate racemase/muconate lactonizing enzyme family protein [archaeon]